MYQQLMEEALLVNTCVHTITVYHMYILTYIIVCVGLHVRMYILTGASMSKVHTRQTFHRMYHV